MIKSLAAPCRLFIDSGLPFDSSSSEKLPTTNHFFNALLLLLGSEKYEGVEQVTAKPIHCISNSESLLSGRSNPHYVKI
jgi:hypothetical protein